MEQVFFQLLLLIVGFVLLVKGADAFVDGAAGIAARFGIPQLIIGLTIVAMGTSAPEAAVSITSALQGSAGITIGNVVGSNIMNVLVILGLTAVITNVKIQNSTLRYELPYVIVVSVVLLGLGLTGNSITFMEGVILWALFLVYLGYLFFMQKKGGETVEEEEEESSVLKLVLSLVIGAVVVVWGSDIAVGAATEIARIVGLSERIIGLTIIAFGTSLPELVTSVTAARKGQADIAIGNIVGSNLFNILFVVGTTALITPVVFESKFLVDSLVAIGAAVLLWLCTVRHKELRRWGGALMLLAYAAYFVYLIA